MLFSEFGADPDKIDIKKDILVGIPNAFAVHSLWPLFSHFFASLGVKFYLSEKMDKEGLEKLNAPFCFPGEIAHGMMEELVKKGCDYYFVPHFKDSETMQTDAHACLCPIVQGFPYYIRTAFQIPDDKLLKPVISFNNGFDKSGQPFIETAKQMGFSTAEGKRAFKKGMEAYKAYLRKAREVGLKAIELAEKEKQRTIVIFGRPYNAFTRDANMGIPRKFTSRGYSVIPFDFIPFENAEIYENMYWYYGQQNLRAAVNIAKYKYLYMCYISNFSCAPDSFILHYMRWINGTKPFLILELDSHTADAGVDTRIEAFLDIVEGYARASDFIVGTHFHRRYDCRINQKGVKVMDTLENRKIDMRDKRIKFLLPNMGSESTEALSAIIRRYGIDTETLPVSDRESVQLARNVASGKECIPCLLVLGSFIKYFNEHGVDPDRIYVLFMPITTGPCRTGQYAVFYDRILRETGYDNIAVLKLNSDNSYNEMGPSFSKLAWHAICTGDAMKDLKSGIRVCLKNPQEGFDIIDHYWKKMLGIFEFGTIGTEIPKVITKMSLKLRDLPRLRSVDDVKKVLIVGEIFVRRDDYSVSTLIDILTEWDILVRISGLGEWIHYLDFVRELELKKRMSNRSFLKKTLSDYYWKLGLMKAEFKWKYHVQHKIEEAFKLSGLFPPAPCDMKKIMARAHEFTSKYFETEATLSPSVAAEAMNDGYAGIVIIAPFACLPGRLIESIYEPWARDRNLPVIALENDGNVYPPNLISKINIFSLNASSFNPRKNPEKSIN
jgi:predicted nucleotide-binding protein (sugar kinase/HSP70/actin superfamily)